MPSKRTVKVGNLTLGNGSKIAVQSMLCCPPEDIEANLQQARELYATGCHIVRLAIPTKEAVALIPALKKATPMPVVADIHFDYRLALASIEAGADKIRINPGNLGGKERLMEVARACRGAGIPIRVGVNSGSLERDLLAKFGAPTGEALAESALRGVQMLEDCGFEDIVVSVKSSDVKTMVDACRIIDKRCPYPQHLGVTEAGTARMGLVKSAAGIGALLLDGIGDTIRVSLTDQPTEEVKAAYDILQAVGLWNERPQIISCPTCGRCRINVISLAKELEEKISGMKQPVKVAVMGCAVNGPGEAREADFGIAGGDGEALLFRKGKSICKIPQGEVVERLLQEIENYAVGEDGNEEIR